MEDKISIIEYVNAPREMTVHDIKELVERALATPGVKVTFLEDVSGLGDTCLLWTGDATTEEARSALEDFVKRWVGPDGIGPVIGPLKE